MIEIPFYCPLCSGEIGELLQGMVMATPFSPTIRCYDCGQEWRMNLYAVGAPNDEQKEKRERLHSLGYRANDPELNAGYRYWWCPPPEDACKITEEEAFARLNAKQ